MVYKTYISQFLRKFRLLDAAERFRYQMQRLRYKTLNNSFRKNHPEIVLPPDFFIYETYRLNISEYYHDGLETAKEIVELTGKAKDLLEKDARVLDWGCGPGRIVRHLPSLLPEALIYGTDYNNIYVQWCKKNLPAIQFDLNAVNPPLNYANDFFDLIIGISVFTHLSQVNHDAWIKELHRTIKPGGLVFLTTQGAAFRPKMLPSERSKFDQDNLVTREKVDEGNRLYSSFQPAGFIRRLIDGRFEIAGFIPGHDDAAEPGQDQWLVKKNR